MPDEFEGDLAGAVFWGADLSGARFRDVDLTGATISHAWLVDVDVDALVEHVVINGVDVTDYVNERDPWYPLRAMLRPAEPAGMRAAWEALEAEWATTIGLARALPRVGAARVGRRGVVVRPDAAPPRLRHRQVVHRPDPRCAPSTRAGCRTRVCRLPVARTRQRLAPSLAEALGVRADRATRFRDHLASITPSELERPVDVLENGTNPVRECVHTVFEEAFWHNRYARRDLARLGSDPSTEETR